MKEEKVVKLNTELAGAAGVAPSKIAVIYGDKIYNASREFGGWEALIDLDDLPNWGDVANDRRFFLGDITYIPEFDENGDVSYISAKWGDPLGYGGYCYLYPIQGLEIEIKQQEHIGVLKELIEAGIGNY